LCLAAAVGLTRSAGAHDGFHAQHLRLLVKPDGLHLSLRYAIGSEGLASKARSGWDQNRDGRIDRTETASALDALGRGLTADLELELDGVRLVPEIQQRDASGVEGSVVAGGGLSASFRCEIPLDLRAGPQRLSVHARGRDTSSHVPVELQVTKAVRLLEHNGLAIRSGDLVTVRAVLTSTAGLDARLELSAAGARRAP
jgi:hypothetical protein